MTIFRHLYGAVYIFENLEARRVKVGMTINDVAARLEAVNDMWLGRKVTCQICGGRRFVCKGLVPQHVLSGSSCPGGEALPLEKDVALAQSHLEQMRTQLDELSDSAKGSVTRKIKTLEKRIELYRQHERPAGEWQFRVAYYTECAEQVELLSHEVLAKRLDGLAPFGEVFSCSVSEAAEAVETTLRQLGLLNSARREPSKGHNAAPL
jgi:hypothetical protein